MESWIICLEECLPDFGVSFTREQIEKLAKIMQENASCISDMAFEMTGGRSTKRPIDYKQLYESVKHKAEELERENLIYRKSVATRRRVDLSDVRIENGSVMIY